MDPTPTIERDARAQVVAALRRSPVVAIIGPRQCGKTTLAREFVASGTLNYFDLEDPASLARLDAPMTALQDLSGLVVIDEVQRRPDLFPVLRVLVDRPASPSRFLILGSAAPAFLKQPSESLAGRIETVALAGFSLAEVGANAQPDHWLRGGFPRSMLAASDADSFAWRHAFIQTLLERDFPQLGVNASPIVMRRLLAIVAHHHGQVWHAAEPARALGVGETTIRRYIDFLDAAFILRQLPPWHANLMKRQVKASKIFVRDSGLLHLLLGIRTPLELLEHPKTGASWEGYAVEELLKAVQPAEAYFWATHGGAELDLLIVHHGQRIGVECKRADAPRITPSMRIAMQDLELSRLIVLYPGQQAYPLGDGIQVVPLAALANGPSTFLA